MSDRRARLEPAQGPSGDWYVRLTASNGEPLMHSETYAHKTNARRGRDDILDAMAQVLAHELVTRPEPTRIRAAITAALAAADEAPAARCNYASPTPWGVAQCALPVHGPEVEHAYSPSEALEDLSPTEAGDHDD